MKLYESSDTYLELIQATAADRRIPAVYVEKDYWVTRVLKRLHESAFSETVVFKGGTMDTHLLWGVPTVFLKWRVSFYFF